MVLGVVGGSGWQWVGSLLNLLCLPLNHDGFCNGKREGERQRQRQRGKEESSYLNIVKAGALPHLALFGTPLLSHGALPSNVVSHFGGGVRLCMIWEGRLRRRGHLQVPGSIAASHAPFSPASWLDFWLMRASFSYVIGSAFWWPCDISNKFPVLVGVTDSDCVKNQLQNDGHALAKGTCRTSSICQTMLIKINHVILQYNPSIQNLRTLAPQISSVS